MIKNSNHQYELSKLMQNQEPLIRDRETPRG